MFTPNHPTPGKPHSALNLYRLPARLDVAQTAELLGFTQHDMQILMREKLLVPLGKPAPNGPKWFAACIVEDLRADTKWLNAGTKAVTMYWKNKRERLNTKPAQPGPPAA